MGRFGLGRWVISAIFRVSQIVFGCFGQSLKVIMYTLLYVYEWTGGQVLSFVKKNRLKCKKDPFTIQAETIHVKMPRAGPKRPVTITV